ncbi:hypothetical protein DL96DRAFT_1591761 [Flagelloscypha sp. PMI_526]|nr:hypothetical protein DL96DRAFT_1591761 [Flagelloscypha sp. PMI_526]
MGDFDLTVGVLLIGLFVNTWLYGLVCYQFIVYYGCKFNDPFWIRTVVGTLFFLDTLHSAVAVYGAWEMCVTNYANPVSLFHVSWTISFTAVATSVAAIITQGFLSHRIMILRRDKIVPGCIFLISVVGCIFGFIAGIKSGIIGDVRKFAPLKPLVICWLGAQTAADVLITSVLTFTFSQSRTGFSKTDTILNRLIRGAIQTGLFSSIFALADLFCFLFAGTTNLYAMFAFPIGRIYTNTLLDTLISRQKLKSLKSNTETDGSNSIPQAYRLQASQAFPVTSIQVQKDVVTDNAEYQSEFMYASNKV